MAVFDVFFLVLTVFCRLDQTSGFISSKYINVVLPIFNNTFYHDVQTETVFCRQQQVYLNISNPASECPSMKWLALTHPLKCFAAHQAMLATGEYSAMPDVDPSMKNDPTFHFDNADYIQKTNDRLIAATNQVISTFNNQKLTFSTLVELRSQVATILHTIQDFYSHSNWVEAGVDGIAENIGIDGTFALPLITEGEQACKECDTTMTAAEKSILDSAQSNGLLQISLNVAGWKAENTYVCRDNIVLTDKIHTGYYAGEVDSPKGAQCSHGGGLDGSSSTAAVGGINKDGDSLLLSPHYYLHLQAADKSLAASTFYLDHLKSRVNPRKWGQFLGLEHALNYVYRLQDVTLLQNFLALPMDVKLIDVATGAVVDASGRVEEKAYAVIISCRDCDRIDEIDVEINGKTAVYRPERIENGMLKHLWHVSTFFFHRGDSVVFQSASGVGIYGQQKRGEIGRFDVV